MSHREELTASFITKLTDHQHYYLMQKRGGGQSGAGGDNNADWTIISNEDLDKTVRYVEASTRKKKVKKI